MTLPTKRPSAMSPTSWKELKKITQKYPYLIFPYLNSLNKRESTSTYSFTIYRPAYPASKERHVIFKGNSSADTWILVLPPTLQKDLQVICQSIWEKPLQISKMKQREVITVHETLPNRIVQGLIRSLDTPI